MRSDHLDFPEMLATGNGTRGMFATGNEDPSIGNVKQSVL